MKQTFKVALLCMVLCTSALFMQCEKADEPVNTAAATGTGTGTENIIAFDEVLATLQNPEVIQKLQELQQTASLKNADSGFGDLKNFTKFDYRDFTLYSLYVSEYTDSRPYFLYYTIEVNKQTREEKSGFLQFRPQIKQQHLIVKTFTGQLHLIDNNDNLLGGATFNNGNMTSNSMGGITTCTTTVVAVGHPCSNGGDHGIGETCDPGFQNDAYLTLQFFTDCKTTFPTYGGGGDTGGGTGGISYTQAFLNSLNGQQRLFLNINPDIKNEIFSYISSYGSYTDIAKTLVDYMNAGTINIPTGKKLLSFFRSVSGRSDHNFAQQILDKLNESPLPVYTTANYPGKNKGMPFEWWNDNNYIKSNLKMPIKMPTPVEGKPNAREIFVFAFWPVEAVLHIENSTEASDRAFELWDYGEGPLPHIHNGKADAFRHTYWNALDTAEFGAKVTKIFTDAHEWESGNHPLETEMDLFNNQKGRDIGVNYSYTTPTSTIRSQIMIYLTSGFLKYLTPLAPNEDNNILPNTTLKWTNQ